MLDNSEITDQEKSTDRRTFLKTLVFSALALKMRGDFGKEALDVMEGDFSPEELKKIAKIVEEVGAQFSYENLGHLNAPFFFKNGVLTLKTKDTDASKSWDCFDASEALASALDKAGFKTGGVLGEDAKGLWGIHARTYIEKGGEKFELDLMPPYHHNNRKFSKSKIGHRTEAIQPIEKMNQNPNGRAVNTDRTVVNGFAYTVGYEEKGKEGFMYRVALYQPTNYYNGENTRENNIEEGGSEVELVLIIDQLNISEDGDNVSIKKAGKCSFRFDKREERLVPVQRSFETRDLMDEDESRNFADRNSDIIEKALKLAKKFQAKADEAMEN